MTRSTPASAAAELDQEQLEALIVDFMRRELVDEGRREIDVEENLFASGLVDSVGFMRLVGHVSHSLGVSVPAPDLVPDNFRTVRVMAAYLERLRRR